MNGGQGIIALPSIGLTDWMTTEQINEFKAKVDAILASFRTLPLEFKDQVLSVVADTLRSNPALCATALMGIYDHFYLLAEEERATQFYADEERKFLVFNGSKPGE